VSGRDVPLALRVGLIVNPVAGLGARAATKGSDDIAVQQQAAARGGSPRGADRGLRALRHLGIAARRVTWLTWGGAMGEAVLAKAGLAATVLGRPDTPPTATDTVAAARAMRDAGAELIVFCGGDGTARDLLRAIDGSLPVLGIPAGVKMHSGVFATTPEAAADVLAALIDGGLVQATMADVRDLDEAALREGRVAPAFYGEMAVPALGGFLQHTKESGRENEALAQEEIAADVCERIREAPGLYLLGPGSTVAVIKRALGLQATLLGVDVLHGDRQVGQDVDAAWLEGYLRGHPRAPATLVLSFTRGQGFLLGRGNLQLTPAVLRRVGRERLWVVGTRTKVVGLSGRPLLIDSDDVELDVAWQGLVEIVAGYQDRLWYRIGPAQD
jgi:predicted polyphosphate/ATP-dependent NAD kinase